MADSDPQLIPATPDINPEQLMRLFTAVVEGLIPADRQVEAWAICYAIQAHFESEAKRQYGAGYGRGLVNAFLIAGHRAEQERTEAALVQQLLTTTPPQAH